MFPSTAFILRVVALIFFTAFTAASSIKISRRSIHSRVNDVAVVNTAMLANNIEHSIQKLNRGMHNYKRNTRKPHPLFERIDHSKERTTDGEIPLSNFEAFLWYASIAIGTPPQEFTVDVDTGSADLFVPRNDCHSGCKGHAHYNPGASSTSTNLHTNFSASFQDNSSVIGLQYTDVVTFGDYAAYPQTLAAATVYSPDFNNTNFPPDGLLGLAFQSLSHMNARPVFQTLVDEEVVHCPMFAFKLSTTPNESMLTLGGVDPDLSKGEFTWVPLSLKARGHWQAPLDRVSVNGKEVGAPTEAIFDTGTNLLVADHRTISKLYAEIPDAKPAPKLGNGLYTIPCDFSSHISITIGGKDIHITPASFIIGVASPDDPSTCVAGAASASFVRDFWILGDVFLQNVYSAWDVGNVRIGFADLR